MFETNVRSVLVAMVIVAGFSGMAFVKKNMTLGRPTPRSKWATSCRTADPGPLME